MKNSDFGSRFKLAFGNVPNSAIARKMGVSNAAIANYVAGRMPPPQTLIDIAELTNCNIHWLLTGKGSQFVGKEEVFDVEHSIEYHDDWRDVIDEWYEFEGRSNPMPGTMGASFMGGWQSFDLKQKVSAITDFKNFLDTLSQGDDHDDA